MKLKLSKGSRSIPNFNIHAENEVEAALLHMLLMLDSNKYKFKIHSSQRSVDNPADMSFCFGWSEKDGGPSDLPTKGEE